MSSLSINTPSRNRSFSAMQATRTPSKTPSKGYMTKCLRAKTKFPTENASPRTCTPRKKYVKRFAPSPSPTPPISRNALSPFNTPIASRTATPSSVGSNQSQCSTDRFIPCRSAIDFDSASYNLTSVCEEKESSPPSIDLDEQTAKQTRLKAHLKSGLFRSNSSNRVLTFKERSQLHGDCENTDTYDAFNSTSHVTKSYRYIPSAPTRVLDAPDLVDDYYLNLLSWSDDNILAVALGPTVYLWNATTCSIQELLTCDDEEDIITSVNWSTRNPNAIAVGTTAGDVQVWDAEKLKRLRTMGGHSARVGSLSWNGNMISSGSRDTTIINHDVRAYHHQTSVFAGHTQEVCGLTWSPDGSTLASGGNCNTLCLWDAAASSSSSRFRHSTIGGGATPAAVGPRLALSRHTAAVKALAWCPFQRNVLASGGGTADRTIKFWNTGTGALLNSVETGSQVCALLWSTREKELLSSHGFSQNQLCVWKYPTMERVKEMKGHTARVLHLAPSPDGVHVVSAAADETLRFWRVFGDETAATAAMGGKGRHGRGGAVGGVGGLEGGLSLGMGHIAGGSPLMRGLR